MDKVMGIRELTSAEMAAHRKHVHTEARERIGEVGGALRVSLNNLVVGSLREYIALSRHQLEMSEYINIHTGGSDDPDDLWVNKIHWPDLRYYPFQVARRPIDQNEKVLPPAWAVEQLRDVMWRVKAVGSVLGRSGKHLVATDADGLTELSNHQCEIADFLKTGKFKKVPRRRKARYLGGDGTQSAETAERVRELGEVLKEYQGRIEIKTVRDFIALSKHQCELAGMVIASEREMKKSPVFEAVHYTDAYPEALQKTNDGNPPLSPLKLRGDYGGLWAVDVQMEQSQRANDDGEEEGSGAPVGKRPRERATGEEEWLVMSEPEGRVERHPSTARSRGESASPGVPFCDTFGHAKVSEENLDTPILVASHADKPEHDDKKEKDLTAGSGLRPEPHISDRQLVEGTKPPAHHQRFLNNEISGSSLPVPGYKLGTSRSRLEPANGNSQFEAVPLDPDKVYDLPRVPFYPDGTIPLPADGRWVRVDTPDGPMAMRMHNPQPPPEPYWHNDVWEDDYWDEDWDDDP